jgi:hypothetical protein
MLCPGWRVRSATARLHAAMVHHPNGKVYIIELDATRGTWVDSLRLEKHRPLALKDGFRCADSPFRRVLCVS